MSPNITKRFYASLLAFVDLTARNKELEAQLAAVRKWADSPDIAGTTVHAQRRLQAAIGESEFNDQTKLQIHTIGESDE